MNFLADYSQVTFAGLDKVFEVPAVAFQFTLPFGNGTEITIRWYGIIIALGYTLAVLFGGRMAYTWKMSINKMIDVLIYGTFGGIVGARAFYVIFQWDYYSLHPAEIFRLWEGGLAIYGGIIGGLIAAFITCRLEKLSFTKLLDLAGMSLLIGQSIGRWGNFMNQEAFGTNTTLPWGMTSDKVVNYILRNQAFFEEHNIEMNPNVPVHPTFLYESLWCALGFVLLYIICKKFKRFDGQLFLGYGIWYAIGRAIIEGLRTDSLYIGTLRISQLISILIAVIFTALYILFTIRYIKSKKTESSAAGE
ncbi:MAG: Prolipoprotein diacylglyceryl transferase [Firmicutes bacterium ADurb.Bin300]|jgi:phosphatidylglycerol:prolipoprotein diacylglycerol transferase|nr:MAG: Prolipoprotein diacylglyceryl transferase [Firmicutes bacterium ADurb.Bin300]